MRYGGMIRNVYFGDEGGKDVMSGGWIFGVISV
jgi:hypothetical protein